MIRHKTFIGMLVSTELVLNGAGLNFMAMNKFLTPDPATGQIFTLFIMGIAAAEAAIVVSFILAVYRKYKTSDPDLVNELKG
jgi:NADH:ubiquinone oxidoreductase subunit K